MLGHDLNLSPMAHYRLAIAARTLLATAGGYTFAALCSASLALALPLPRPQAVLAATQLSFALYCALVIWSFSASSARRAWIGAAAACTAPALHLLLKGVWS